MKLILNTLLFVTVLLGTACTDHIPSYPEEMVIRDKQEKLDNERYVNTFLKLMSESQPGDFVHYRGVYWRIESTNHGEWVWAGINAGYVPAKEYNPTTIKLTDDMRLLVKAGHLRGARYETASRCWTITSTDDGHAGLLAQWTNR